MSQQEPLPLVVVWPFAAAFWTAFVWTFFPEYRLLVRQRKTIRPGSQDAGSRGLIIVGNTIAMWGAFALAFAWPRAAFAGHRPAAFWTGVVLLTAGGVLRRHCFRMLGTSFTGAVTVRPGQVVVQRGAYRWVRHPSYSAAFLIWWGMGLALTNWSSLGTLLVVSVIVYAYRVRVEERALLQTLGQPYLDYMRRTKRFVPFLC